MNLKQNIKNITQNKINKLNIGNFLLYDSTGFQKMFGSVSEGFADNDLSKKHPLFLSFF